MKSPVTVSCLFPVFRSDPSDLNDPGRLFWVLSILVVFPSRRVLPSLLVGYRPPYVCRPTYLDVPFNISHDFVDDLLLGLRE